MHLHGLLALLLCVFIGQGVAWTKDDHEIFRLRDELLASEGANVTFYQFIGVTPTASNNEIEKVVRRKSRQLHPDKARQAFIATYDQDRHSSPNPKADTKGKKKPGVHEHKRKQPSPKELKDFTKKATERYARLSVIAKLLQNPGTRDRYDHFLKNGFPLWRGTGYYYARYRPGIGTVLSGLLVVFGGFAHYGAMYLSWKRQREFVERYIRYARRMAWGDESGIPGIPGVGTDVTNGAWDASIGGEQNAINGDDGPASMNWNRKEKRKAEREGKKATKSGKAVKGTKSGGAKEASAAETAPTPQGAKKRVIAENGKVLVVDSAGNVFLEEENEDGDRHEYLLDVDEITKPKIKDTVLFRLPVFLYDSSIGRIFPKNDPVPDSAALSDGNPVEEINGSAMSQNGNDSAQVGGSRKRRVHPRSR